MGRAPAQARPPGRGNPGQRGVGGCSLGSLASAPPASLNGSLISRDADPAELAVTVMTALPGGLLLAQTTRDARPLELALDMAIAHAGRYRAG